MRDTSFRPRRKSLLAAVAVLACGAGALQFIRPRLINPPVTGEIAAPPEVRQILKNACYDCHSNEGKLAWFDEVVPAYWLVNHDVREARRRLNFSEIGKRPAAEQSAAL